MPLGISETKPAGQKSLREDEHFVCFLRTQVFSAQFLTECLVLVEGALLTVFKYSG